MKKFVILALLGLAFAFSGTAQVRMSHTTSNPTGAVVNTGKDTSVIKLPTYSPQTTFQLVVTKVSGTVGGTCYLQGSLDGVTYVNSDTLTLSDQAVNVKQIVKTGNPFIYYRAITTGTGTMSATANHYVSQRK